MQKRTLVLAIAMATSFAMPASADYNKRVCGGEDQANGCPVSKDIMLGCNPTEDDAGNAACSYTSNGQRKVFDYHADRQGSHEGGKCGYTWYLVTCFTSK
ncbi:MULTISPECIES: hypothetical protein [unclassified Bradyrhizobium]|uniref:hypothetical protein n=1 Tax=unclassified Bradyrhizobium TaxID=2631580 RepID=UPI001BAA21E8|nr:MULTISPECIES: hypothetical protein [unclassified Bradyrhizobium]MBR1205868.1 hypothetical protein [Bradyrhizobium sp. AUGA SZCCT0124]MBR1315743.1 hypothetical protein [Bradyrhizobium sp. AUGA SZCCT0051]MBR1338195.1 hypothetical protein [Bradyrhizobium sp. AUGA SZCCT0105]MBR1355850.1 hypothetical protein [Bradyrhizobium sp. AUGA SZCCT0045]